MPEENLLLKDSLFNSDTVSMLANALSQAYPKLNEQDFINSALSAFPNLELKERMSHLTLLIEKSIDADFEETLNILERSLKFASQDEHFVFGAYQEYIMIRGCTEEHLERSLEYMGKFTSYFSAEFAIRPFINNFPEKTYEQFKLWSLSDDHHQRRLASEGLRPKLPWAPKIEFDYSMAVPVLDNLYYDSERYVTRSVANHMNDISKIDPDLAVKTLEKWKADGKQDKKEMTYVINHSLRTLIKKGHPGTLDFLGYPTNPNISIENKMIENPSIQLNDTLIFNFDIVAHEDLSLIVDYNVNYPMAKGKRSDKVFKIKKLNMKAGESISISKKHLFKSMTTKKLYTGTYDLSIRINGMNIDVGSFDLTV